MQYFVNALMNTTFCIILYIIYTYILLFSRDKYLNNYASDKIKNRFLHYKWLFLISISPIRIQSSRDTYLISFLTRRRNLLRNWANFHLFASFSLFVFLLYCRVFAEWLILERRKENLTMGEKDGNQIMAEALKRQVIFCYNITFHLIFCRLGMHVVVFIVHFNDNLLLFVCFFLFILGMSNKWKKKLVWHSKRKNRFIWKW